MLKHYLCYLVKYYDQYKFGEALGFIFIFTMCLIIKVYLIRHLIFKIGYMHVRDSVLFKIFKRILCALFLIRAGC